MLPGLRSGGDVVEAIDLPGSGGDQTPLAQVSMDAYAERICAVLRAGEPAVLVGHSMGGIAITQAATRCPERVRALIYVAAFAPAAGQNLADLVAYQEASTDEIQANMVVSGDPPVATLPGDAARHAIYNRCTTEQAEWGLERRRPQAVAPFEHRLSAPEDRRTAFEALPRAYVVCTRDHAIPPAMQRRMLRDAGCDPVVELEADHSPALSATRELVDALQGIVGGLPR